MNIEELAKYARETLSDKRFNHTKRVVKVSEDLAELYNVDPKSARAASWLHDIAKEYDDNELRDFCMENNIELDRYIESNIKLAHGIVGAYIARDKCNIKDQDILNSIKNHTLARKNMSDLEKIIYLSDIIEEGRKEYPGLNLLRSLSYTNLNKAMALALELSVLHLTKEQKEIHPRIFKVKEEYNKYEREEFMDREKRVEKMSKLIYDVIDSKTSMEVTALDVREITTLAEVFIIATAPNTSLVSSISEEIEKKLSEEGFECAIKEGKDTARWILLDYNGVIVHILHEEEAEYYKLEKLWSDGKNLEF